MVGSSHYHLLHFLPFGGDGGGERGCNVHLSFRDLAVDNAKVPSVISLHLRHSKTDPTFKGVKVYIGRTGDDLCPVSALLHYLTARGNHPGPLFVCENGKPLIKSKFVAEVRVALTEANLPTGQYAGHIGAATTVAAAGLEDSLIQTLGRWRSSAYLLYVCIDPRRLAAMSNSLAKCQI